ncbi:MAG: HDOD domain-containing protein [Gammaproteobacteria bacterium]
MSAQQDLNAACFKFVANLATDLNRDDFDLPGYPVVVIELQRLLSDEDASVQDIVKLINSEPALAARLVKLANSAAFNANNREICEPRAAITQLGFNIVRSTATEFALKQMKQQDWLKPVIPQLEQINRRSTGVAAIAAGVAIGVDTIRSDEALAAGLFHQIGNLYLLTRAHQEDLVAGNPEWESIVAEWHPTIARAIIESWGISQTIGEAAENQDTLLLEDNSELSILSRIVAAGKLYSLLQEPDHGGLEKERLDRIVTETIINGVSFKDLLDQHKEEIDKIHLSISG